MKKIYLLLFALLSFLTVQANDKKQLSDNAQISILTCGTGEELYALFGHTAIRVFDPMQGIDRVYNYGMFDFNTPNFYAKFVKGDLLYFVDYDTYKNFVISYAYDNRSVYEQTLNLEKSQKQAIWDKLNESLANDQKYYVYKFIDQNCTTKVVDLVNHVLEKPLNTEVSGNTSDYRNILNTYLKDRYFEKLGINLIFGSKVDKKSNMLFLPDKFMQALELTKINGNPLVKETEIIFEAQKENTVVWWNTFTFALVLSVFFILLGAIKIIRRIYFILFGLLGIFFAVVGFYSLHGELLNNNSVFLCSPLLLLLPFLKINKKIFSLIFFIPLFLFAALNITSEKLIVGLPVFLIILFSLLIEMQNFSFKSITLKNNS